jgi:hypothetical protein
MNNDKILVEIILKKQILGGEALLGSPKVDLARTTSCVHEQAYNEIIEDGHPVLIIAGVDICGILRKSGYNSVEAVSRWLQTNFSSDLS